MTVDDLLKATVIMSANDAAVVLAEYVAGSEDEFVQQMNQRAKELGMEDTTFLNCNGLDKDGHLTSAYDVAVMSRALISHEKIYDYTQVWMDSVRDGKTQLVNTNKLLKTYNGITGLKTGTTSKAGSCISATASRDGLGLIAVVLGCATTNDRFQSAAALLDSGFANWESLSLSVPTLPKLPVTNGVETEISCLQRERAHLRSGAERKSGKGTGGDFPAGQSESAGEGRAEGGEIQWKLENEVLKTVEINAAGSAEALNWLICLRELVQRFCCFS